MRHLLALHIVGAHNIPRADRFSESDPYVVATLQGQSVRTETRQDAVHPSWGETFLLPVTLREGARLEVAIWDADLVSSDDLIGRCAVDLRELEAQGGHRRARLPITLADGLEARAEGAAELELELRLMFQLDVLRKRIDYASLHASGTLRAPIPEPVGGRLELTRSETHVELCVDAEPGRLLRAHLEDPHHALRAVRRQAPDADAARLELRLGVHAPVWSIALESSAVEPIGSEPLTALLEAAGYGALLEPGPEHLELSVLLRDLSSHPEAILEPDAGRVGLPLPETGVLRLDFEAREVALLPFKSVAARGQHLRLLGPEETRWELTPFTWDRFAFTEVVTADSGPMKRARLDQLTLQRFTRSATERLPLARLLEPS